MHKSAGTQERVLRQRYCFCLFMSGGISFAPTCDRVSQSQWYVVKMSAISWKVPKIHGLSGDIFSYACPPSCCLECLFVIPPSYPSLLLPQPQATTDLLFVTKVGFPFLEFCINRIILYAPFLGGRCISLCTWHHYFAIRPCCILYQ